MLRNRLLRTLTLLSCVVIASGDGYDLRGLERLLLERYLASGSAELPDCPGETVNMFYDMNITIVDAIYCPNGDESCTNYVGNCTDDDFINIGLLLEKIVAEVEEEYPRYKDEFVDTKVCAVPYVSYDEEGMNDVTVIAQKQEVPPWLGGKRNLVTATATKTSTSTATSTKRKTGKYTYKSGGRCRACKSDNADRRVLAATAKADTNISQKEAAAKACSSALSAKSASEVTQRGILSSNKVLTEVKELALAYKNVDLAEEFVQNVTAMREAVKNLEGKAKGAMNDAYKNCDLATDASTNTKLVSQTLHYMSEAEKKSEAAVSYAKTVYGMYRNMTNTKLELKKLVLNQNFEIQKKELDDLIEIERSNKVMMEEEMEDQIRLAEEQLKLTQDKVTKTELEKRKAKLEKMKLDKEAKFEKMEEEIQKMEKLYKERLDYQIKEADILLAMEGAVGVSEWLMKFGELLQHTIPPRLYELYKAQKKTKPTGCLTAPPIVKVTIEEKESWAETYKSNCELKLD